MGKTRMVMSVLVKTIDRQQWHIDITGARMTVGDVKDDLKQQMLAKDLQLSDQTTLILKGAPLTDEMLLSSLSLSESDFLVAILKAKRRRGTVSQKCDNENN